MQPSWTFAPAAARDLRRITEQSREGWGLAHSIEYAEAVFAALQRIAAHPSAGINRDELCKGLRGWPVRSHMIFYRVKKEQVEIARILHGRQDPRRFFG